MPWYVYLLGALGLGVGGFFAARSSKFWISMVKDIFNEFLPALLKRKSPEEEAKDRQDYRENKDRNKKPGTGGRNS